MVAACAVYKKKSGRMSYGPSGDRGMVFRVLIQDVMISGKNTYSTVLYHLDVVVLSSLVLFLFFFLLYSLINSVSLIMIE